MDDRREDPVMRQASWLLVGLSSFMLAQSAGAQPNTNAVDASRYDVRRTSHSTIEPGPRPEFLVNEMNEGPLKRRLMTCLDQEPRRTDFSIGHRGAALQFPEHTKESYVAAARMGAGIVECDVTFTKDKELVCRHAQN